MMNGERVEYEMSNLNNSIFSQEDEEISLITDTPLRSTNTKFKLNIPWQETTAGAYIYTRWRSTCFLIHESFYPDVVDFCNN